MKVAKFGGSSVANAAQFQKVANIITSDEARKLSSSLRRENGLKTTQNDGFVNCIGEKVIENNIYEGVLVQVVARYDEIVTDLQLSRDILDVISAHLQQLIDTYHDQPERLLDALKASGEDNNAKLMAHYLRQLGYEAHYVSPKDAGIFVTDEPGNAQVLPESYEQLAKLNERSGILIIPGFSATPVQVISSHSRAAARTLQVRSWRQVLEQSCMKTLQTLIPFIASIRRSLSIRAN